MSRGMFTRARTGKRASKGGFTTVDTMKWDIGKSKRVVIPVMEFEDGSKSVGIFGQTIHRVTNGVIQLPKKSGGTYSAHTFRCSHPYSQFNHDDAVKVAKSEEMCVLCEYEKLQDTRRFDILEKTYGTEEKEYKDWIENFKPLSKEEKMDFYKKNPITVEKSYYAKEDSDGEKYNVNTNEMYLLLYDIEVEEVKVKRKTKAGKVVHINEVRPVLDKNEKVQYKPVLFKVSEKRLNMFKDAIDNALASETISYDTVHTYLENEGTDMEEEVNVGFIDFELKYPQKDGETARMESARDMTVHATVDKKSILVNTEGLIDEMKKTIKGDYKAAKGSFENVFKNLQLYSRKEQLALLSPDARGEFQQLREEFRTEADEDFEKEVYSKVLETAQGDSEESEDVEELDEVEEAPKKESKKKTKKEAEPAEELDDDIDFDEDELFDE